MSSEGSSARPEPDKVLVDIADYVTDYTITGSGAYPMARYCLMDALGCAVEALSFPECINLLGPVIPEMVVFRGAKVPGTQFTLDPVSAAFNLGTMIRWLDFNDASGAAEGAHPSDNLGGVLVTADYVSRKRISEGMPPLVMRDVLTALIKAYEIQGGLSLENSLTDLGFDHVTLIRVATTAVATHMLGGGREQIINGVSNAFADGASLKIYRQGANTGPRKSWAGGDATSRGVRLALMALKGEIGYPTVLTAKKFGFYDAIFRKQAFKFQRAYSSYVIEHVRFKFVPAGMHGQTAAECAFTLHPLVKDRLNDIDAITIKSHQKLTGIMDKQGPLTNHADRDHCVQYVIAVVLIYGKLETGQFSDEFAADPRIDELRAKMTVVEEPRYTREYLDPEKRTNANAIEIRFKDGSSTPKVEVEYTIGHFKRRAEGLPMVEAKFRRHLAHRFPGRQQQAILDMCLDEARLQETPVNEFVDLFVI